MSEAVRQFGWRFLVDLYRNRHQSLHDAFAGSDHILVKLPLFAPIYVSRSLELATQLFKNDDVQFSRREAYGFKGLVQVLEDGVLTAEGEVWEKMRSCLQPAFHRKQMDHYLEDIAERVAALRNEVREAAEIGRPFVGSELARRLSLEVMGKAIIGTHDLQRLENIQVHSDNATFYAMHWALYGRGLLALLLWPLALVCGWHKRCLARECDAVLAHHSADVGGFDMISVMKAARDDQAQPLFSRRDILNQIATMVIAGYKTTTSLMTAALYEIARHPQVADKIRQELAQHGVANIASMVQLKNLVYLDAVIKEVLRLRPSVQWVMRKVRQPLTLASLALPQDSMCFINLVMLHRSEKYWRNPDVFLPERHFDRNASVPGSRIAFGVGKRICIGKDLAVLEAKMFVVALVSAFEFSLAETQDHEEGLRLILEFKPVVAFCATPVGQTA